MSCFLHNTSVIWRRYSLSARQRPTLKAPKLCRHLLFAFKRINTRHVHIKVEFATGKMQSHLLKAKRKWAEFIISKAAYALVYIHNQRVIQPTVENFGAVLNLVCFCFIKPSYNGFKCRNNGSGPVVCCNCLLVVHRLKSGFPLFPRDTFPGHFQWRSS